MNHPLQEDTDLIALSECWSIYSTLHQRLSNQVHGRDADGDDGAPGTIHLILQALFANGHIYLEDYPGSGKSFLAKTLGDSIEDDVETVVNIEGYRRIQCTPDLLPGDVTGYNALVQKTGQMQFRPGPVFGHIVLVDEINRTTPKVQSSMLEAMAEHSVTVDGETHALGDVFFVIATANPLDQAGTYPLPAASLDRFLFKRRLTPIESRYEIQIMLGDSKASLERWLDCHPADRPYFEDRAGQKIAPRVKVSHIALAQRAIAAHCHVDPLLVNAVIELCRLISEACHEGHPGWSEYPGVKLRLGSRPSSRALKWLMGSLKVLAFVEAGLTEGGGSFATSPVATVDLLPRLASDFLRHRLIFAGSLSESRRDQFIQALAREACARVQARHVTR